MVKHRQLRDDLFVERQTARAPDELPLRQKSIVKPHPPPDPVPLLREPQSRHDDKVNEVDRHRLAPAPLPHARSPFSVTPNPGRTPKSMKSTGPALPPLASPPPGPLVVM